jgi:uncharacterized OsmC-like protein
MNVNVRYLDGVKFEAEARGHRVLCDQPAANGGADEGMSPPEFLLASLGTCVGYYAAQYLRARKLPTDGLAVRVEAEKASGPARLAAFRIAVDIPEVDERHREGVLRASRSCLIHNTLEHSPDIQIHLRAPAAV